LSVILTAQVTATLEPMVSVRFNAISQSYRLVFLARQALIALVIEVKRQTQRYSCYELDFGDVITAGLRKSCILIRIAGKRGLILGDSTRASFNVRVDACFDERAALDSMQPTRLVIWEA
jgi:hypothetical protein